MGKDFFIVHGLKEETRSDFLGLVEYMCLHTGQEFILNAWCVVGGRGRHVFVLPPMRDLTKRLGPSLVTKLMEKHTEGSILSVNLAIELTRWVIRPKSPRVEECVPLSQQLAY